MPTIVNDPGFRQETGTANLSNQLQAYGQQAVENRQNVGAAQADFIKQAAAQAGLSISEYLRRNPEAQQSMYSSLLGINQGNRKNADLMFEQISNMQATPDQMFNAKIYDALEQELTSKNLFDTKRVREVVTSDEFKQTVPEGKKLTTDDIKSIMADSQDNGLWSPIAEKLGMTPVGGTSDLPIWGEDFDNVRNRIIQTYLPGYDLQKYKSATGQEKANLNKALRQGMVQGQTASDLLNNIAIPTAPALPETLANMTPEDREEFLRRTGGVVSDGQLITATQGNQDVGMFSAIPEAQLRNQLPNDIPGAIVLNEGKAYFDPQARGAAESTDVSVLGQTLIDQPAAVQSAPVERVEQIIENDPGWFTQFNQTMTRIRQEGGIDAQKSLAADQALRDAEATIDLKQSQSALYKAQLAQAISAMNAPLERNLSPEQKSALDTANKQYFELYKEQLQNDFAKNLNDKQYREQWENKVRNLQNSLSAVGLSMNVNDETVKNRFFRDDIKAPIIGSIQAMSGYGGGIPDFGAATPESLLGLTR